MFRSVELGRRQAAETKATMCERVVIVATSWVHRYLVCDGGIFNEVRGEDHI